jgi:hypothetical protein
VLTVPPGDVTVTRRQRGGGDLLVANTKKGLPGKWLPEGIDIDKLQALL